MDQEINQIRTRLIQLEAERKQLTARLEGLERSQRAAKTMPPSYDGTITTPAAITVATSPAEKIKLFRRLFAGRPDVFPVRWENMRTGKSGYAPACANEWVKGICGKPAVKCTACQHQAFVPVSDSVVARHLTGL